MTNFEKKALAIVFFLIIVSLFIMAIVEKANAAPFTPIPPAIQELRCNNVMKSWVVMSDEVIALQGDPGKMLSSPGLKKYICSVYMKNHTIYYTETCSTIAYQGETFPEMKPAVNLLDSCFE